MSIRQLFVSIAVLLLLIVGAARSRKMKNDKAAGGGRNNVRWWRVAGCFQNPRSSIFALLSSSFRITGPLLTHILDEES